MAAETMTLDEAFKIANHPAMDYPTTKRVLGLAGKRALDAGRAPR